MDNYLKDLAQKAHDNSKDKLFWNVQDEDGKPTDRLMNRKQMLRAIPEKLSLIHEEVSEALGDYRSSHMETTIVESGEKKGKPEGFATELADTIIRIADLAGALGIDLEMEIKRKMEYNSTREPMHGRAC